MRRKNGIYFILLILILVAVTIDIVLLRFKSQEKNTQTYPIIYVCKGKEFDYTNDINLTYHVKGEYRFLVSNESKIMSGHIDSLLQFKTPEEYQRFVEYYQQNLEGTNSNEKIDYNEDKNEVKISLLSWFNNYEESDETLYTKKYVKVLEEQGFTNCTELK